MGKRCWRIVRRFSPLSLLLLLPGCHLALLDPQGSVGIQERNLILTATWVMLIVVVPVIVLTLFFAWRYRASNPKAAYRPEWSHSRTVEAVVWAVPAMIVLFLAVLTWRTTHTLDPYRPLPAEAAGAAPLDIDVVSLDWKWLFIYPKLGVASVNQLAMPVGTPVDFHITSDTVMNSFFIPELGSQVYSMAGMVTQLHLIADRRGDFPGMSANFSGPGFSDMTFDARAMTKGGFAAWVRRARRSAAHLDAAAYKALEAPSRANKVTYYSQVAPGLFGSIVTKYDDAPAAHPMRQPMVMSAGRCEGAKTCSES